jgi:hypothetical protein
MTLTLLTFAAATIEAAHDSEQEGDLLKAVFIYNFAKFTRWPTNTWGEIQNPLVICSIGNDRLTNKLEKLNGKTISGHLVTTNHQNIETFTPVGCHLLYIASSMSNDTHSILQSLQNRPILTVSGLPGFSQSGGMIELKQDKDKIRFIINLRTARDAGLELSARLLNLATVVEGGKEK